MPLLSEIKIFIIETEKLLREFKPCIELEIVKKKRLERYKKMLQRIVGKFDEYENKE